MPDWSSRVVVVEQLIVTIHTNIDVGISPLIVKFLPEILGGTAPLTFEWDFGDGSPTSSEEAPQHKYTTVGKYEVKLTVTDSTGLQTTCTRIIEVKTVGAVGIMGYAVSENIPDFTESAHFGADNTASEPLSFDETVAIDNT